MFTSPFRNLSEKNEKKLTFSLVYLFIISMIALRYFNIYIDGVKAPYGIVSFEFAGSLENSLEIINSWSTLGKICAGLSLGYDFLFLIIYTLLISLFIHKLNVRLWTGKSFYKIGEILIWSMFLTAAFDAIENVSLIKLLVGSHKQYWSSIAFTFATLKFILIAIALLYLIANSFLLLLKKRS